MNRSNPFSTVVAEAPPAAAKPARVAPVKTAAGLELDGDEIIQLSIKPSLWFIPAASARVLVVLLFAALALGIAMQTGSLQPGMLPFQILLVIAALRLGMATLQWASRLYVLTNRRVLRFTGALSVQGAECRLSRIAEVEVHLAWYGRLLRLGTLHMRPTDPDRAALNWDDVSRPFDVHEIVIRAVRNSQSRD